MSRTITETVKYLDRTTLSEGTQLSTFTNIDVETAQSSLLNTIIQHFNKSNEYEITHHDHNKKENEIYFAFDRKNGGSYKLYIYLENPGKGALDLEFIVFHSTSTQRVNGWKKKLSPSAVSKMTVEGLAGAVIMTNVIKEIKRYEGR